MSRSAGLVILTAAGVLAAVTMLKPAGTAGRASPIDVPPPPSVGDCVTGSVPAAPDYAPDRSVYDTYPRIALTARSGDRYAEVAAVLTSPAQPTVAGDKSLMNVDDPNATACWYATATYLGADASLTLHGAEWTAAVLLPTGGGMAAPTDLQQSAGQRWTACLVTSTSSEHPLYGESVRGAVGSGAARDDTGLCFDGHDDAVGFTSGSCRRPHTTQLIAQARADFGLSRRELASDCHAVLVALIGRDITSGNDLAVLTTVRDARGALSDADPVSSSDYLSCAVTTVDPRQTLTGGVLGLRDHPIPWT